MPNPHGTPANLKPRRKGDPSRNPMGYNQYNKPGSPYLMFQEVGHDLEKREASDADKQGLIKAGLLLPGSPATWLEVAVGTTLMRWISGDKGMGELFCAYCHGKPQDQLQIMQVVIALMSNQHTATELLKLAQLAASTPAGSP